MSSEQLLVLLLLAAAFAAGWFARGGRGEGAAAEETADDTLSPAPVPPALDDPLLIEADAALGRAVSAARAARAVAIGPAGASEAATRAVLGVLDRRLSELEDCADRLEVALGPDDAAFAAYDRVVSGLHTMRRQIDGDTALDEVEDARVAWEHSGVR